MITACALTHQNRRVLMKEILKLFTSKGEKEIILDFFAGSGTMGNPS